ncbi:hypothetical protein NLI96_g8936 [Meripilus lineatus]|uniref:Uncharacterized protein n=1 Tax=Meripilus lineatus TaxID=2056292 RepID=A0AAD5YFT8_9APHY|nr:hypothetical protein NLI96_g8936 [Physisporinus lineatus]
MSSTDAWADFETTRHAVKHNTVDRLKQVINGFNEECGSNFTKGGKKQDIIDKITTELDGWRRLNAIDKWTRGKAILNQVRATGSYTPTRAYESLVPGPYTPASNASALYQQLATTSHSTIPRFPPAPRMPPVAPTFGAASSSATPSIRFKPSPFFKIERLVSPVVECPESTSQSDRRQQTLTFPMSHDIIQKLSSQSPKYQLRLYCTSSLFYHPTSAFRPSLGPCPIEFPPTCEVRVNGVQLTANLKGMKKKPGTAPPPDIGKALKLASGAANRVEMVYVNSQQPIQSKKFYLVAILVEVTSVETLVERLKKGKYKSSNEIQARMAQNSSVDDDIVAGHQKMTLKCPLSYMRIATPCRSWHCVHSQCFDATSWFQMMEQTTTWLCPTCEKALNVEDLIIDGYFDEILNSTPSETEDVIVEPDGQWHSEDGRYASAAWLAAHPPSQKVTSPLKRSPTPVKPSLSELNGKAKSGPSNAEIVILDSDDEDEGRVKRELSPSTDGTRRGARRSNGSYASLPARSQTVESDIIDLTLDSDDELPIPPSRKRRSDEREAHSPTEQIWKKSRIDSAPLSSGSLPTRNLPHFPTSPTTMYPPPTLPSPDHTIHYDRYVPAQNSLPPRPPRSFPQAYTWSSASRPGGSGTSSSTYYP